MNDHIAVLETIHAQMTERMPEGTDVIDDPTWISVLMSMAPYAEVTRPGNRWVEIRSERLDVGRTVYAVTSRRER